MQKKALISVSDKSHLIELARSLVGLGYEIVSTGSTAKLLSDAVIEVTSVEKLTGFPEILGGRVKTLHPMVFGGILAQTGLERDQNDLNAHGISPLDIIVCNLYPFGEVAESGADLPTMIENIDIGGVSLLRAAAKNHQRTLVLCDPRDYSLAVQRLKSGTLTESLRRRFALKAFAETAAYDTLIATTLKQEVDALTSKEGGRVEAAEISLAPGPVRSSLIPKSEPDERGSELPPQQEVFLSVASPLRYGENPHQAASLYRSETAAEGTLDLTRVPQLHGKELSYNNYLDLEHGVRLMSDLPKGACAILKHNCPCGVAVSASGSAAESFALAFAADSVSPFGGVVLFTAKVDRAAAEKMGEVFLEIIVAPSFDADALDLLQRKKNLRLIELDCHAAPLESRIFTQVQGGFLVQDRDELESQEQWQTVTQAQFSERSLQAAQLAWAVVKNVRSNAIVLSSAVQTFAIAGGFTNRVDAVKRCLSLLAAGPFADESFVLASDGFFPFADSIELLAGTRVEGIVQPGGSLRDADVIAACERERLPMIMTGARHFKH